MIHAGLIGDCCLFLAGDVLEKTWTGVLFVMMLPIDLNHLQNQKEFCVLSIQQLRVKGNLRRRVTCLSRLPVSFVFGAFSLGFIGFAECAGEMFIHHAADVSLEVGEKDAA